MHIRELIEVLEQIENENPNTKVFVGCEGYINIEGLEFYQVGDVVFIADGCGGYLETFEEQMEKDQDESIL